MLRLSTEMTHISLKKFEVQAMTQAEFELFLTNILILNEFWWRKAWQPPLLSSSSVSRSFTGWRCGDSMNKMTPNPFYALTADVDFIYQSTCLCSLSIIPCICLMNHNNFHNWHIPINFSGWISSFSIHDISLTSSSFSQLPADLKMKSIHTSNWAR